MQTEQNMNKAKQLRVDTWIGADGQLLDKPIQLTDLGDGYKVIYCFQHWCPGCHSHGFPTLKKLHENLSDKGFGFAVIQTVFEGAEVNTFDKLQITQDKYDLKIPFGHDTPLEGEGYPSFMKDYSTRGTPWFTVIDPQDNIVYAGFNLDADVLLQQFEEN